jgi:hypothetical protein
LILFIIRKARARAFVQCKVQAKIFAALEMSSSVRVIAKQTRQVCILEIYVFFFCLDHIAGMTGDSLFKIELPRLYLLTNFSGATKIPLVKTSYFSISIHNAREAPSAEKNGRHFS